MDRIAERLQSADRAVATLEAIVHLAGRDELTRDAAEIASHLPDHVVHLRRWLDALTKAASS